MSGVGELVIIVAVIVAVTWVSILAILIDASHAQDQPSDADECHDGGSTSPLPETRGGGCQTSSTHRRPE